MKNSKKAKEKAHQTEVSSSETNAKDLICRLPDEILLYIIGLLIDEPNKYLPNRRKKIFQGSLLTSGKQSKLWIYEHNPESPIMTDLQAFSVVNSKIHAICKPFIWKSISFPTVMSGPMSYWDNELLLKYGIYVQVLDVLLRSQWIQLPERPDPKAKKQAIPKKKSPRSSLRSYDPKAIKFIKENKDYWKVHRVHTDNLAVFNGRLPPNTPIRTVFGLSPENLIKVISHCQNLSSLHLSCANWGLQEPEETADLSGNLSILFTDLKHLQHLKLRSHEDSPIFTTSFVNPLSSLTLLESLELMHTTVADWEDEYDLLKCLSKFEHLKKLVLRQVHINYAYRCCGQGPPQLVDLTIRTCDNISISNAPLFISSWAPHLTHLEIELDGTPDRYPEDHTSGSDPKLDHFVLPDLTHLTVWFSRQMESLKDFLTCKNLSHLTLHKIPEDHLVDLADLIISNIFPKLKSISFYKESRTAIPSIPESYPTLSLLEESCKSRGIRFGVFYYEPNYDLEGSLDSSTVFAIQD